MTSSRVLRTTEMPGNTTNVHNPVQDSATEIRWLTASA